jgi:shikimate kinase
MAGWAPGKLVGVTDGHIVLVGPMGVGKTTVGAEVARRLGRPLRDSDGDVDARASHRNARELAERQGVEALHRLEADLLLEAVASPAPSVVAAAASVVEDPRVLDALQEPFVVWLAAPPELLVPRLGSGDHRRDLGPDPHGALQRLAAQRESGYRAVADARLEVGDRSPGELALAVLDLAAPGAAPAAAPDDDPDAAPSADPRADLHGGPDGG